MEFSSFSTFFVATVIILWAFLLITISYKSNTSVLRKKGFKEEYVDFLRKDMIKRGFGIAIAVPVLLLLSAAIVWLITGDVDAPDHLIYIALLFIVLVIPFPVLDMMKLNKKYRDLAIETRSAIVVDFNYKVLHLVFNPLLEALISLLYILYFVWFIELFHVSFLHLLILWFLYAAARSGKFLTRPLIKDGYIYLFIFLILNQLILLYHLLNVAIHRITCADCYNPTAFILGTFLGACLVAKLIYYLANIPKLKLSLSS